MLRISATTIDAFSRYVRTEGSDEQKLIRMIKKEEPPSRYMKLGVAFHEIIENPHAYYNEEKHCFEYEGIVFEFGAISKVYSLVDYHYPFEVKTEKDYYIGGEQIRLVAKVDQIKATYVQEFKTCWSQFDIENYTQSYQWRIYADIFGAARVDYTVACLQQSADGIIRLTDEPHTFNMYPYVGMDADLADIFGEISEWIHFRKLENYFQPKGVAEYA